MPTGPVTFVYSDWVMAFRYLANVSEGAAEGYFAIAEAYVANPNPTIRDASLLTTILYLTTAHIATLLSPQANGAPSSTGSGPPSPLVGRIDSATEGSVTVSTDFGDQPASAAWWSQTQAGSMAWKLLAPFRTARYIPGPRRVFNPPVRGGWGWGW